MFFEMSSRHGGEAAVRDSTMMEGFDAAEGNASLWRPPCAALACRVAVLHASCGPSEGYRPPQDDIPRSNPL